MISWIAFDVTYAFVLMFFNAVSVLKNNNSQSSVRPELHSETILGQLLHLDAIRLCAQLTTMVTDDSQYKQVVAVQGPLAQTLLNLLQAVCDSLLLTIHLPLAIIFSAWMSRSTRHSSVGMLKH
jgi:hypothetical protein